MNEANFKFVFIGTDKKVILESFVNFHVFDFLFYNDNKKNKARLVRVELCYIYGLVSTRNQIPYTILKIIFANQKENWIYFIHILYISVDKGATFFQIQAIKNSGKFILFFSFSLNKKLLDA